MLPDEYFELIHGKAGVITLADGAKTALLGSVNESKSAWTLSYELLWEDPWPDAVAWGQQEFDALWTHHAPVPLAAFILEDIDRLSRRKVMTSVEDWHEQAQTQAASVFVEAPVERVSSSRTRSASARPCSSRWPPN